MDDDLFPLISIFILSFYVIITLICIVVPVFEFIVAITIQKRKGGGSDD